MAHSNRFRWLMLLTALWLGWMGWYLLLHRGSTAVRVVDETGRPVAGVEIVHDDSVLATTDDSGTATVEGGYRGRQLDIRAPGYLPGWFEVPSHPTEVVEAQIDPSVLRGVVADSDGRPVPGVTIRSGQGSGVSARDGSFEIRLADAGPIDVWKPAWVGEDFTWDGSPGTSTLTIEPRMVKAVHVNGETAGDPTAWAAMVHLVDTTELNAVMLDLKDETGSIFYDTHVERARQAGAVDRLYDLAGITSSLHADGTYVIGRIVSFQDPTAARAFPDMAVGNANTGSPYSKNGQYFLDPTDPNARAYAIALAKEACGLGVDEIQFDYVRFPDGFPDWARFDGDSSEAGRVEAIRSFLSEAKDVLHPQGCAVAADIFGFLTTALDDGGIGQDWEMVTSELDVVSPMVYPSHYSSGWFGYEDPNQHPGPVVDRALSDGIRRMNSGAVVRPWLQDFGYTDSQVRAQIDSAESHGLGWMLWNAVSNVSVGALDPQP